MPQRAGICRTPRRRGDGPRDLSGHGGADPQPEHHAFPRRRADAVFLHQLRHGHLSGGPHGHEKPAAGHRGRAWQRRDADLPHSDLPCEGAASTTTRANRTTTCSSWPAAAAPSACSRTSHSMDAPFNLQYYKEGHPETEIAYMGCRTRVIGNVYDPSREIMQRPRQPELHLHQPAAPRHPGATATSTASLSSLDRDARPGRRPAARAASRSRAASSVRNFPFLMGQGVWMDSEKLGPDDEVREVLKHGTLSVGFIGLAETPEGADRRAPRRKRRGAERLALRSSATCVTALTANRQATRPELLPCLATPGGGPFRPLCPDGRASATA